MTSLACARGEVAHAIMPDTLSGGRFRTSLSLNSRRLLEKITYAVRRTDEYVTYKDIIEFDHHVWISQCYEQLLDLLAHWRAEQISVEPDLGAVFFEDGYNLRFGMPDLLFYNSTLKGICGVEVKTGLKRRPPQQSKMNRYAIGLMRYATLKKLPSLKGLHWISFAETGICCVSGSALPLEKPAMHVFSEFVNIPQLSQWCLATYNVPLVEILDVERYPFVSTKDALKTQRN